MGFHSERNGRKADGDQQGEPAPDDAAGESGITNLVTAAQRGDRRAWAELIRRFNPLVLSVIKNYRLSYDDCQDVRQTVWLQLYENITRLREPRALPGWIRTTTRNEALHQVIRAGRAQPMDPSTLAALPDQHYDPEIDGKLLRFERDRAIHDGLTEIEPGQRKLLLLLHLSAVIENEKKEEPTLCVTPTN